MTELLHSNEAYALIKYTPHQYEDSRHPQRSNKLSQFGELVKIYNRNRWIENNIVKQNIDNIWKERI